MTSRLLAPAWHLDSAEAFKSPFHADDLLLLCRQPQLLYQPQQVELSKTVNNPPRQRSCPQHAALLGQKQREASSVSTVPAACQDGECSGNRDEQQSKQRCRACHRFHSSLTMTMM